MKTDDLRGKRAREINVQWCTPELKMAEIVSPSQAVQKRCEDLSKLVCEDRALMTLEHLASSHRTYFIALTGELMESTMYRLSKLKNIYPGQNSFSLLRQ